MKKPELYRAETETDSYFDTRRQAFRKAKRDNNIPGTSQPVEVLRPNTPKGNEANLDNRNRRLYIFKIIASLFGISSNKEIHIREDKGVIYPEDIGNQLDHFNSGEPPAKLKKHHYFKK